MGGAGSAGAPTGGGGPAFAGPQGGGGGPAFGGGPFGGGGGFPGAFGPGAFALGGGTAPGTGSADDSVWQQKQTRVVAVPDLRTSSVVISAGRGLMAQIAQMIADLDRDPAKKQQVFVYSLQNTDGQAAQEMLETLFPSTMGTMNSALNSRQQNTAGYQLSNRASQNQNQRSGIGSSGGPGGAGGGIGGGSGLGAGR